MQVNFNKSVSIFNLTIFRKQYIKYKSLFIDCKLMNYFHNNFIFHVNLSITTQASNICYIVLVVDSILVRRGSLAKLATYVMAK